MLAQIFGFEEHAGVVKRHAAVVEHHRAARGRNLLHRALQREHLHGFPLHLCRKVEVFRPIVFLVGQPRAVEEPALDGERRFGQGVRGAESHVAHVAHLLGYEGAVGEELLVGRAVRVDAERHAHLSDAQRQSFHGQHAGVGIEHTDAPLVGQVYLGAVNHDGRHVSVEGHTGIAHLKAPFFVARLVFALGAERAADFRQPLGQRLLVFGGVGRRFGECRQSGAEAECKRQ